VKRFADWKTVEPRDFAAILPRLCFILAFEFALAKRDADR